MHFDRFICISKDFMRFHDFRGRGFRGLCGRNDAPKETFTRSQLAAFSSIFIDFRGFHEISWISCIFIDLYVFLRISWDFMRFHDFRGRGLAASADVWGRNDAPKETFTRSQLAAVSSIFMDFSGFHEILWISCISIDFHVFLRIWWLAGWLAGLAGVWLAGLLMAGCWLLAGRMMRRRGSKEF